MCCYFYVGVLLVRIMCLLCFFFFKQKTAYEMRISDWSSDVCSSDLPRSVIPAKAGISTSRWSDCGGVGRGRKVGRMWSAINGGKRRDQPSRRDRKSVV